MRLLKAPHLDRIFNRLAGAAKTEAAIGLPSQRRHAEIERGLGAAVERNLALAGAAALLQGRKIHIGIAHRALDLVDPIAGEEHHGAVGIYPLNLLAGIETIAFGSRQKIRHRRLVRLRHRIRFPPNSALP